MNNPHLDQFMASFPNMGLTFDDVSLVTQYADFLPDQTDVSTRFSRNIGLNIPFISAAMDTVTQSEMAIAIAVQGGIGVIHKNQDIDEQANEVALVKHYLNGLITDPVVFRKGRKVSELLAEKDRNKYQFSGFPIVDDEGRIIGLLTSRDTKFLHRLDVPVEEVMTTSLVTAKPGTSLGEAFGIMMARRIGKLPIVDATGRLVGLYSFNDVKSIAENVNPTFNRDDQHRLRVAAAISPHDGARIEALLRSEVDALVIDTAHGHTQGVIETVKFLKANHPHVDVVAGNIGTAESAKALMDAGADAVKVGIGPGSICTTRVVAGVGIPQLSAVYDVRRAVGDEVPVISDGGITYSGDVAKAVSAGADSVMMGSVLAATEESPGEKILHQGRTYVVYRGMGSLDAMKAGKGSRERYSQGNVTNPDEMVPQGIEGLVPYRGKVAQVLHQYVGGLRFALGYCGARTLPELQAKARFVRISSASLNEAHPHGVKVIKDAPNYQTRN